MPSSADRQEEQDFGRVSITELSYVSGISDAPLLGRTIGQALDRAAEQWGDADALVSASQGVRWSWRELATRPTTWRPASSRSGLEPGDRIGIWSPNCAEWALTQFAAAKIGLILININPGLPASELEFTLNKVGCKALVTADALQDQRLCGHARELGARARDRASRRRSAATAAGPAPGYPIDDVAGAGTIAATTCRDRRRRASIAAAIGASCTTIRSTSSSPAAPPGSPKGATLSHRNILNNGCFVGQRASASTEATASACRCRSITASAW